MGRSAGKSSKSNKSKTKSKSKSQSNEDSDDGFMGFGFDMDGSDSDSESDVDTNKNYSAPPTAYDPYSDYNDIDVRRCDPLTVLIDPYRTCMKSIQHHLIDLTADILTRERFSRFPKLCNRIRDIVANSIVPRRYQQVISDIEKRIMAEKRCVWTDNVDFNTRILPSVVNGSNRSNKKGKKQKTNLSGELLINPGAIRQVLYAYFSIIKDDLMNYIHKDIIAFFVREVVADVNTGLNDKILDKSNIDALLEENKDKAAKRAELYALKQKINMIKTMINDMQ